MQTQMLATTVLAGLEQKHDERAAGAVRLRWPNAGHPPSTIVTATAR